MSFAVSLLAADNAAAGSAACAGCHADIYRKYMTTGMARSSGRVGAGGFAERFTSASFQDPKTGASYRITKTKDVFRMEFARPSTGVRGERDLRWFIGSGRVGRSYVFSVDDFLFQAPVSYYSSPASWNLSPGYSGKSNVDLAKPVEEPCFTCHSSRIQLVENTQNRYLDPPFLEGGVGCERCHGDGKRHIAAMRSGKSGVPHEIVNPARLDPARRDSICEQCHLTGAARVPRLGRGVASYRPGDFLGDHLSVFVWQEASGESVATDHAEQLARSRCRAAAGARMWCGTCHDAHSQPAESERADVYRRACLGCHAQERCTATPAARAAAVDDCAACHMPKSRTREGEHVAYTNHTIARRPSTKASNAVGKRRLESYWRGPVPDRDVALAYASFALTDASFRPVALELLERSVPGSLSDAPLLAQLAQFYDNLGRAERAEALYEQVMRLDPSNAAAGANLGIYRMRRGRAKEAIALWRDVLSRNPALPGPGINLAQAQLGNGDKAAAELTLLQVLRFHPDLEAANQLLQRIRAGRP
jgi:predicted CXXCH cytochrome family protein